MIAFLRGPVIDRGGDWAIVDAGGVGYMVVVTARAARSLPDDAREARLHIYTHATQDSPWQLFGFPDVQERRLFETLISVQGVGPKAAIGILSSVPALELVRAVTTGDLKRLTQVKGIGKKLAERLCVELRDKIGAAAVAASSPETWVSQQGAPLPGTPPAGRLGEVHGALVFLGFRPDEIARVLPGLDKADAGKPTEALIKDALALLRKDR